MKLTVLQWNTWYQEDIHHIIDFLRDHPADVVCLQEMLIDPQTASTAQGPTLLSAQLGLHMHTQEVPVTIEGRNLTLAIGIFTKYPIVSTHYAWINTPQGTGGLDDQYQAYIEARIALPDGSEVSVGTAQMSYSDQFQDTPRKQAETKTLLERLKQHSFRYIFCGDLNATPPSATVESFNQILTDAGPSQIEPTWTTKPTNINGFEAHALGWRLDYIFTTADVTATASEILPTVYSDHLPIFAELEL